MKFISKAMKMPLILPLKEVSPKSNTARSVVRVVAPKKMDVIIILEVSINKAGFIPLC